jgi:hypothetical protein
MCEKRARIAVIDRCKMPFLQSGTGCYDSIAWEISSYVVMSR